MDTFRFMETSLFALVNFLPFVILSIYTFNDRLRFSKKVTYLACVGLFVVQCLTRYYSAFQNEESILWLSLLRLIVFLSGYAILIDVRFGKLLFMELIFANMGNFIIIAAVCLERNLFPEIEHRMYCWHTSVVMILLHLLITLPFSFSIRKYYKPMITHRIIGKSWDYYWIVPAIFYTIWQYQLHGGSHNALDTMTNSYDVIFLTIIQIGSFLIYYLILRLDGQLILNMEMERQQHYANIEALEYKLLEERIEEARRVRHDVRHHMVVMADYLDSENYDALKKYFDHYRESVPEYGTIQFCPHRTINTILLYFAHQAREHEIDFQVQLSIPEQLPIIDTDISIILGNLLENAVDACKESTDNKQIIIRGNADNHAIFFTIDNTCTHLIKKNTKGRFLSTKKKGAGIGIESVKNIVKRYHGVFTAEKKDDMFYVSFMLNI